MDLGKDLQRHDSVHEARADHSYHYNGIKIAISDGGPYMKWTEEAPQSEYPMGWYGTKFVAFLPQEGSSKPLLVGQVGYYSVTHDMDRTDAGRKDIRIKKTRNQANNFVDAFLLDYKK